MQFLHDIRYGEAPEQALDLYLPEKTRALYLFIHGGGLAKGDKRGPRSLFDYLGQRGIATASINYRMMPQVHFPVFIEDCALAAAFARRELLPQYAPGVPMFIGGSSAGAYLSMMLAFDRHYLAAHGLEPELFAGFLLDAGQPTTHFALLRERGLDEKCVQIDETAPLYHVRDARPSRPLLILTAENDMPARVEQNALLYRVLLNFGYPQQMLETHCFPGYRHCGYCGDVKPDGSYPYAEICSDFILRACQE